LGGLTQKSLFGRDQDRLVNRAGFDLQLNPLAAAVDDGEHGFLGAGASFLRNQPYAKYQRIDLAEPIHMGTSQM
jgi:hypothetical protein